MSLAKMEIMMEVMQERMREMQREMKTMDENCKRMAGLIESCYIMICSKNENYQDCPCNSVDDKFVTIGIENLEIRGDNAGGFWCGFMPEQIGKLCNLKTVKIERAYMMLEHLSKIAHPNVTSFTLKTHFYYTADNPDPYYREFGIRILKHSEEFTIENMPQFPALKSLELSECTLSGFDPSKLLEKYPELTNISITSCTGINQTEITTFCASHKITLVFV
jgi:hypothetical protein